jgi:hypothetical protein
MSPLSHVRCRGARPEVPWRKVLTALLPAVLLCAGCAAPSKSLYERFQDENPAVRAQAAAEAGTARDPKALPYLVDRLGDPEAEVRLMASAALREWEGPTYEKMGWRFYEPPARREEAQERWRQWLRQRGLRPLPASSQPATAPPRSDQTGAPPPAGAPASQAP